MRFELKFLQLQNSPAIPDRFVMPNDSQNEILHSWKEISAYIGRGVRTLQRYERLMGFPIRRPLGKRRSSVMAFRVEVDAWLQRSPHRGFRTRGEDNTLTTKLAEARQQSRLNRERATTNREQAAQIRQMVRQQREQIRQLNEQIAASLAKHSQALQR